MALATARCGCNPRPAPDAKSSQMFICRRCLLEPRSAQTCSNSTANGRGEPDEEGERGGKLAVHVEASSRGVLNTVPHLADGFKTLPEEGSPSTSPGRNAPRSIRRDPCA